MTTTDWATILARLSAHADSIEQLLHSSPFSSEPMPLVTPWRWESLESLDDLPQIPTELYEKALALRARIVALQHQLAAELEKAPPPLGHPRGQSRPPARSVYINVMI